MLGMRITLLRVGKSWSQAELARRIGVSASAIGMYEQGRREPSLDIVVQLARVFGVTTDYLLAGETPYSGQPELQEELPVAIQTEVLLRLLHRSMK